MPDKILVVDDDHDILDAISLTLQDAGYRVQTSAEGEYAMNLKDECPKLPNLILLDVYLSGMDGRDICKELKKSDETHHIPVVMISAHRSFEHSAKKAGADAFLSKPFKIEDLLYIVDKHLPN